jgi:hypothetical protein
LISSSSQRELITVATQQEIKPTPLQSLVDEAAAIRSAEPEEGPKPLCAPARWVTGLLRAFSTGRLHGVHSAGPADRLDTAGTWQEGHDIEYLAVDVVNGAKQMKWMHARVVAVRTRVVRDVARTELRVTYYTNSFHQETTWWMDTSDLRLRAPRL